MSKKKRSVMSRQPEPAHWTCRSLSPKQKNAVPTDMNTQPNKSATVAMMKIVDP